MPRKPQVKIGQTHRTDVLSALGKPLIAEKDVLVFGYVTGTQERTEKLDLFLAFFQDDIVFGHLRVTDLKLPSRPPEQRLANGTPRAKIEEMIGPAHGAFAGGLAVWVLSDMQGLILRFDANERLIDRAAARPLVAEITPTQTQLHSSMAGFDVVVEGGPRQARIRCARVGGESYACGTDDLDLLPRNITHIDFGDRRFTRVTCDDATRSVEIRVPFMQAVKPGSLEDVCQRLAEPIAKLWEPGRSGAGQTPVKDNRVLGALWSVLTALTLR